MKKNLLTILILSLSASHSFGQFPGLCNERISPNHASRGQTLTTTISNTFFFNGYGSAPCSPSDVYLHQSSSSTTINASTLSIQNDSIIVSWNIPSNVSFGTYNLNLALYSYTPFSTCTGIPINCSIPQSFYIGTGLISGSVFFDSNQDSIFNNGDLRLKNKRVLLEPENISTLTDDSGKYTFRADSGSHTVVIENDSGFYSLNNDSISLNVDSSNIDNVDFAIYTSAVNFESDIYINGRPRCNSIQSYYLNYVSYNTSPVNLLIKFYHSPNTAFIASGIPPDSINGDTIYYSVANVQYGTGAINLELQMPAAGNIVSTSAYLYTLDLSGTIMYSSTNDIEVPVLCSYDPNDKEVNPSGVQSAHYTLFGDKFYYTINFQNTGNDTAYDIHIIDTLDANLVKNSLEIISSSSPVNIEASTNGVINFMFNNIMLPAVGTNEPGSKGFVSFTIKIRDSIPEMTVIKNRAHIYFDQNAPVNTNQTFNTMVKSIPTVGVFDPPGMEKIILYPNPFNGLVTLSFNNNLHLSWVIEIMDIQGRVLGNYPLTTKSSNIDLEFLRPGIYFYKLFNKFNNESYIGKLVKQ